MLPLNSTRWSTLWDVYGPSDSIPFLLRKLYAATSDRRFEEVLQNLLSAIYHQHDATTVAYAVAPHLEAMFHKRPSQRLACAEAIALIEAARQNSALRSKSDRVIAVPEDLRDDYAAVIGRLPRLIGACSDLYWRRDQCYLFAATLLAVKGYPGWVEDFWEFAAEGFACPNCGDWIDLPRGVRPKPGLTTR